MEEEKMQTPEPEDYLSPRPKEMDLGAYLKEQAGTGGDPRDPSRSGQPSPEEPWDDLTESAPPAPDGPPPPKESESGDGSDVDGVSNREVVQSCESKHKESGSSVDSNVDEMSNEVIVEYLHCNLKGVSLFPDPAAREFLKDKAREVKNFARMLQEKEHLQVKVPWLEAENRRLQQELQEAKRSQKSGNLNFTFPWSKTDFHVQIHVTGRTENCEKRFLKKVSGRLSDQNINLKVEKYREGSGHLLLVFCPVSSRVGTDMDNALEDLKGEPKVVLVMLHHKPKESTSFVDNKLQAQHPDVVCTVHARYTIQEGFYACPMNEDAVAIVAEVLEDLCKGGKGHPAIPDAPSKSRKLH